MDYLQIALENFKSIKAQAEKAFNQLTIEEMNFCPNEESNSISILVKHMSGNLNSRFKDFLTTDGEKPDRNRDGEFEGSFETKEDLQEFWNSGWNVLFNALGQLDEKDLAKTVYIRNETHSVLEAIQRQIVHQSGHSGQIVYIAKMIKNDSWQTLSIPRGQSKQFNMKMLEK